jgi:hypothetical protein
VYRLGMYIGQLEASKTETWIYNPVDKLMEKRQLMYSPALIKVIGAVLYLVIGCGVDICMCTAPAIDIR